MLNGKWKTRVCLVATVLLVGSTLTAFAAPMAGKLNSDVRCPVCGMFVAKYDAWITQIHDKKGQVYYFDGVKDLLVFFQDPQAYGGCSAQELDEIWVKDYYTLQWISGREAVYVIDSDVHGPMGHEFIPFSSIPAAQSFMKDHQGKRIVSFGEITEELVSSMRTGQRMR